MQTKYVTTNTIGLVNKVIVHTDCWFLPPRVQAITISKKRILMKSKEINYLILAHELVHIQQFKSIKFFLIKYIWEFLLNGKGVANKFEYAAYSTQQWTHDNTVTTVSLILTNPSA